MVGNERDPKFEGEVKPPEVNESELTLEEGFEVLGGGCHPPLQFQQTPSCHRGYVVVPVKQGNRVGGDPVGNTSGQ